MNRLRICLILLVSIVAVQYQQAAQFVSQASQLKTLEQQVQTYINEKKAIPLSIFTDFMNNLPLAAISKKLIENLVFQGGENTAVITKGPEGLGESFAIHGKVISPEGPKQELVDATLTVTKQGAKDRNFILELMLPTDWKFSLWFPKLKSLDDFEFNAYKTDARLLPPRFIFSTIAHKDQALDMDIESGVTFVSGFGLGGALSKAPLDLNKMFYQLKSHKDLTNFFKYEPSGFRFKLNMSPELVNSSVVISVPMDVAIDFTKQEKKPLIDEIKFTDIEISWYPQDFAQVQIGSEAQMKIPTQKDPLVFKVALELGVGDVGFEATMDGDYYPAFGLKDFGLADFGFKAGIDFAAMAETAALGLPITDLEARGKLVVGENKKATDFNFAGKYEFDPKKLPGQEVSVAFVADVDNMSLANAIDILGEIAGKKLNVWSTIPNIKFSELKVYFVPFPTDIAGKPFKAGIGFDAEGNLLGTKFDLYFSIDPAQLSIEGKAAFKDLEIKAGNVDFFDLKNISGDLFISASDPVSSKFNVSANLGIPFIKLNEKVNFSVDSQGFKAGFESKLGELDADLNVAINFTSFDKSGIKFSLKDTAKNDLSKKIVAQLEKFRAQAKADIDNLGNQIAASSREEKQLDDAIKQGFDKSIAAQINKTNATIAIINKKIQADTAACNKVIPIARPFNADCLDLVAQQTALAFQEGIVKDFGLKFGQKVVDTGLKLKGDIEQAVSDIRKEIANWKDLQNIEKGIVDVITNIAEEFVQFKLKEFSGSFTGADVEKLATPKIDKLVIELPISKTKTQTITLKDIQFSFDDLDAFVDNLADQIGDEIKALVSK